MRLEIHTLKLLIPFALLFVLLSLGLTSCSDEELPENDAKQINIYLTDDPLDAEEVNVEIIAVVLKGKGEEISIETLSGIYNLLDLQGDADTLLASGSHDITEITEIRVILGENNTIVIDGETFPLETPESAQKEGIKIKVDKNLLDKTLHDLLIDFDVRESIVEANETYRLIPVIRFKGDRNIKKVDLSLLEDLDSCFQVVFPVIAQTVEGKEIEINNLAELIAMYNAEEIYGALFPFEITMHNGETTTIHNHSEGYQFLKDCIGEEKESHLEGMINQLTKCFELQFPVTIKSLDGSTYEINSYEEVIGIPNPVGFEYPIYLRGNNGEKTEISNQFELLNALGQCVAGEVNILDVVAWLDSVELCVDIQFPITVKLADGTTRQIFSRLELLTLNQIPIGIIFPITIIDSEGVEHEVENVNALEKHLKHCVEGNYENYNDILDQLMTCYQLEFPIEIKGLDSVIHHIQSLQDLQEIVEEVGIANLIFPFDIKGHDGDIKTIQNINQLLALLSHCSGENIIEKIIKCFDIDYPFELKLSDNTVISVNTKEELETILKDKRESIFINFPINLIDEDGGNIDIKNVFQLIELLEDCE